MIKSNFKYAGANGICAWLSSYLSQHLQHLNMEDFYCLNFPLEILSEFNTDSEILDSMVGKLKAY